MKRSFDCLAETLFLVALTLLSAGSTCWGGPPGPPSTPVGSAGVSAATVVAVAVYGYWKSRK